LVTLEEVKVKKKWKELSLVSVQIALNQVVGAYAIAVFDKQKPDEIVVANWAVPLVYRRGKRIFYSFRLHHFLEFTNKCHLLGV